MKSMDVVGSVDYGYRILWAERHYLLRLTAVPILVKLICLTILVLLGWDEDFIKTALVMLPSSFADGWMLSHMARLVFLGQRWPFRFSGDAAVDHVLLADRAFGITAGTLFYVVIKHIYYGIMTLFTMFQHAAMPDGAVPVAGAAPAVGAGAAFAAFGLLIFTIWAFRFMFLYIPVAAGLGTRMMTRMQHSFRLSLQIWAIWLVSVVPCLILVMFVLSGLLPDPATLKGDPGFDFTLSQKCILLLVQGFADTLMVLISTAAIACGLRRLVENETPNG